jgi:hypothetical protein
VVASNIFGGLAGNGLHGPAQYQADRADMVRPCLILMLDTHAVEHVAGK